MSKGVIYILTNPSFPAFVKIGYTDDIDRRLAELNSTECTPFAFRVYATYETDNRLTDTRVHKIIDKLNPELRSRDEVNGVVRIREFFEMPAEDAFSLLEAIAEINGMEDRLHLYEKSDEELQEEQVAQEVEERKRERRSPFGFDKCNIEVGETVVFSCRGNKFSGTPCTVVSNNKVEYDGREWSLSELAGMFVDRQAVAGPRYFKYQDRWLNDIRDELEGLSSLRTTKRVSDTWIIPCNPNYYEIDEAVKELGEIEWRQSTYIQAGDTVYIYVSSPVQAICYKSIAVETDLYGPAEIDDFRFYHGEPEDTKGRHMRLRFVESFDPEKYPLSFLREHGVSHVQSPIRMPAQLEEFFTE